MGLFTDRQVDKATNNTIVPTWFMRQAGRYHSHYQTYRQKYDFMTMCKNPQLAQEITQGPIDDFNFDAAILFSDLLFPLEYIGLGLSYLQGPPKLSYYLQSMDDFRKIKLQGLPQEYFHFQKEALSLIRKNLASTKTLLGFVGGPFTLYTYATHGTHSGQLTLAKTGLYDGRYEKFNEIMLPILEENLSIQAQGNSDAICILDTAAGELCLDDFKKFIVPGLKSLTKSFKKVYPNKKLIYYSKMTHLDYLKSIEDDNLDGLGIDWRVDLASALSELGQDYYIQGNFDPAWAHLPWPQIEENMASKWQTLQNKNLPLDKWICGLGHGITIQTPQENIKNMVNYIHQNFRY